ncbi:MAG: hypothetical protein A2Z83_05845 [Omnitrophica bacterium GWA2_52_8]|nr:MAG: hypothetical protein A2Z83_05845 [Omnitrophica bacterium GWA2_52_8]
MIITKRDLLILWVCLQQKFMTLLQIAKMFFPESGDVFHRPMTRVCELVEAGYLSVVVLKVTGKRFYIVTPKGVKLLKKHKLSDGLRAVKKINHLSFEHDEWVTDVRITFEKCLGIAGWIPERVLKKKNVRKKVPDGIVTQYGIQYVIEVEKTLKNKLAYERIFLETCSTHYPEAVILYIAGSETDRLWLKKQAEGWERIYFATMDDFIRMEWELKFENPKGHVIEFGREYQGGAHFNVPEIEAMDGDDGLTDIHEGEQEYLRFKDEDANPK